MFVPTAPGTRQEIYLPECEAWISFTLVPPDFDVTIHASHPTQSFRQHVISCRGKGLGESTGLNSSKLSASLNENKKKEYRSNTPLSNSKTPAKPKQRIA